MADSPACLKDLCLKLLLVIASGADNVSTNTLLEYLMINSVYEPLVRLLTVPSMRSRYVSYFLPTQTSPDMEKQQSLS